MSGKLWFVLVFVAACLASAGIAFGLKYNAHQNGSVSKDSVTVVVKPEPPRIDYVKESNAVNNSLQKQIPNAKLAQLTKADVAYVFVADDGTYIYQGVYLDGAIIITNKQSLQPPPTTP